MFCYYVKTKSKTMGNLFANDKIGGLTNL